jgi:hypothetical protein
VERERYNLNSASLDMLYFVHQRENLNERVQEVGRVFFILFLISLTSISLAAPVVFSDPNLKCAVEAALGITDPNATEILLLTYLNASSLGISDLTGIEYAINLNSLYLYGNQISCIELLTYLDKLLILDLQNNPLNAEAYSIHIPLIISNNPGIEILYDHDPNPNPFPDIVINGTQVELCGQQNFNEVIIINGGTLKVTPYHPSYSDRGWVYITANSIYVDSTSAIVADRSGYDPVLGYGGLGQGDTGGMYSDAGGGGYGGHGGGPGGGTYGNESSFSIEMGSGGGNYSIPFFFAYGGAGGGAITLLITGDIHIDGQVTVLGANGNQIGGGLGSGAGSGGGILISGEGVLIDGHLNASGGNGTPLRGCGGGGGRIKVFATDFLDISSADIQVSGGEGTGSSGQHSEHGTVFCSGSQLTKVCGTVRDDITHQGIGNAEVFVTGMPQLTAKSDSTGHYEIIGVPHNTLFNLVVSAADYNTAYVNNVQVTETNPVQTVDINLIFSPYTSLRIIELNPNPNSDPMKIMQGGTGHRYYQIVDDSNKPRNGISVTTNPNLGGPFLSSGTKGVVSIDVNSLEVNDGQTITITHLAGVALEPAAQKSFVVNIEPLRQVKSWELRTEADLGISAAKVESAGTLVIRLQDEIGTDDIPETISISRKALLGSGVSVSAEVAYLCRVDDVDYGDRFGAGASVVAGQTVRDRFVCDYNTPNPTENLAKLYLLMFPTTLFPPEIEIIKRYLEAPILDGYREEMEAGLYLKDGGWIKGDLGIGINPVLSMLGLDWHARYDSEGDTSVTGTFGLHKDDTYTVAVEISDKWNHEEGKGLSYPLYSREEEILRGMRFELVYDSSLILKEIKIADKWEKGTGETPYDINIMEEVWTIKGPPDSLAAAILPSGILYYLSHTFIVTEPQITSLLPENIYKELSELFKNIQRNSELIVTYEKKHLPSKVITITEFELDIGITTEEIGVGVSTKSKIIETDEFLVEHGRYNGLYRFPTESYPESAYGIIDIELGSVYQKAFADVDETVLQPIFDHVTQMVQEGLEVIINAGNSALQIGANVLETGQEITNIFETQYLPKIQGNMMNTMANVTADSNASSEIKYFGFGGTYQLQPADLNLPSPGTFSITYSDEEIIGQNEALLRIYRWSDTDGRWEYIGGTVDDSNNTVTASINKFGTYAIGAQVEYGNFIFNAEPNATPSDGNSIVTFTSEVIKNNDGTQVANGKLFTLAASGGTITTTDVNTSLDGVQIVTNVGILQFTLKAPQIGMKVKAEAVSLNRLAIVIGDVNFVDSNAPQPPTGLQAQIIEGKVLLSWNENNEIDLAGYKIYFDDDINGPPYNGAAYYSGSNSPVDVADANSHFLRGLRSGHTYYIAVTAYDMSGNESSYGNEIVFVNTLPEDSDSDGMPDTWEIAYSNTANGLDPTIDDAMADNDGDGVTNIEEYLTAHNPLVPDVDGDFNHDRSVNILDLAVFCSHWLEQDCNDPNWCEGTDLNHSNKVDFVDFAAFANSWFEGVIVSVSVPADITGDGEVDFDDLKILAEQWLQPPGVPSADIAPMPADGIVNFLDFAVFADHWLEGTSP